MMLFLGSGGHDATRSALDLLAFNRALFDDDRACFFGVTADPKDAETNRISQDIPGIRWFLDYDRQISSAFGAVAVSNSLTSYTPHWLLLDPMLRVRRRAALSDGNKVMAELHQLVAINTEQPTAPVLIVPDIFPSDLCRSLISLYEANGGEPSGFMQEVDGITTVVHDHRHKRRGDYIIADAQVISALNSRLSTALLPMMHRAFQFTPTRIERWMVACYDAQEGGHFRPHRDNRTAGTAHRKFACTINLNADDYEGGDLSFPEFGKRTYRAPTGGAVAFSCSLLHEAQPVTRGRRYAFLPFFYDEEGARLRERNLPNVEPDLRSYRSGISDERS